MVLDVAGGTGALSFELENLNGIGCCVLDPRPLRLGRLRKRQRYNLFSSNPFFARYIDVEDYAKRAPRIPRQLRVFLDEPLVEWAAGSVSPPTSSSQSTVATSSGEAEFNAICTTSCEAIWFQNQMRELHERTLQLEEQVDGRRVRDCIIHLPYDFLSCPRRSPG